jgi:hypothetical protein
MRPKLIVLTPVKNEAPILDRFLSVTSLFADHILVADQLSTDASREICSKYNKVTLIQNSSDNYCEAERQILLISTARKLWPGPKILLGLDADEVLAANAIDTEDWQRMLSAVPGTILLLERPDLLPGLQTWVRCPSNPKPFGFVDDGVAQHNPSQIHSPRVPQPENAKRLVLSDIKVVHYGPARMRLQLAKSRFYSVQENLKKTNPLRRRRKWYGYMVKKYYRTSAIESDKIPEEWLVGWESKGIDMRTLPNDRLNSHEMEVLRAFAKHGEQRFWLEPIWDIDWNELRYCATGIEGIPVKEIKKPPFFYVIIAFAVDIIIYLTDLVLRAKTFWKKSLHSRLAPATSSLI